jgi:hypothetical protein
MDNILEINHGWKTTTLTSVEQALDKLVELKSKGWVSRGHSIRQIGLIPKIDRNPWDVISDRADKIALEQQSIELFRRTVHDFDIKPEERQNLETEINTLMMLRHYDVPTRLLDWSMNPFIATYFAVNTENTLDGELWSFDGQWWNIKGSEQWPKNLETKGKKWEELCSIALAKDEPPNNWVTVAVDHVPFDRVKVQEGVFTFTSQFGHDHADSIKKCLEDRDHFELFIIKSDIKSDLRMKLQDRYEIFLGKLFPDLAGAAEMVKAIIFPEKKYCPK